MNHKVPTWILREMRNAEETNTSNQATELDRDVKAGSIRAFEEDERQRSILRGKKNGFQ